MTMAWLAVIYLFAVLFLNLGAALNLQYALAAGTVSVGIMARRLSATKVFKNELTLLSLMGLASVVAVMSQNLRGYNFIWRDMMIFPRLGYYACIILRSPWHAGEPFPSRWKKGCCLFCGCSCGVGIVQYFDVLHLNKIPILPS
jgi:hypothetical protein